MPDVLDAVIDAIRKRERDGAGSLGHLNRITAESYLMIGIHEQCIGDIVAFVGQTDA
jgi:hypothetical protein